jgi:hypothetical protein
MSVRRYRYFNTCRLRRLDVDVGEVKPLRICIQFQMAAAFAGGSDDAFHVEIIWFSRPYQAASRVPQDRHVAIVHGPDNSLGLHVADLIWHF